MKTIKGYRVGAAIATFNNREWLRRCLEAGEAQWSMAAVLDDASTDGTREMLSESFPDVTRIAGDGDQWWTGGTNRAIEACLTAGCDHVLLLNPDVVLEPGAVEALVSVLDDRPRSVAACLVVDSARPDRIWWAGSRWDRRLRGLPIMTQQYLYRAGTPVDHLPTGPYPTDEVHGRGVLVPAAVFRECGLLDEKTFPHYGGDVDYSHRLRRAGVSMWIVPSARARLAVEHTGMGRGRGGVLERMRLVARYLTERKNGEALRVWFALMRRHAQPTAILPSYAYVIAVNVVRRMLSG